MYQADRGTYQKKETVGEMIYHSCLGKLMILAAILGVVMIFAYITCPSTEEMDRQMLDNVRMCIEANDSIKGDWLDDAVRNVGYIFTDADSLDGAESMEAFHKYNRMESTRHGLYSTTRIIHYRAPEGIRIGIGIFGMVIPTLSYDDLLLRVDPLRKDYGDRIIKNAYSRSDTDYELGLNPHEEVALDSVVPKH